MQRVASSMGKAWSDEIQTPEASSSIRSLYLFLDPLWPRSLFIIIIIIINIIIVINEEEKIMSFFLN